MFLEDPVFPECISYGSRGGPKFSTAVIRVRSGREQRNTEWKYPLCQYNVVFGIKKEQDVLDLRRFFMLTQGTALGFRFKDPDDYSSAWPYGGFPSGFPTMNDQFLGAADGVTTEFQLTKTYEDAASGVTYTRKITKPIPDSILIANDGILVDPADYTEDSATGIITFAVAPVSGDITAGFYHHTPCRFESDVFSATRPDWNRMQSAVNVTEIRT